MDTTPPMACQLTSGDYAARRALIRALTRDALLSAERRGLALHLRYRGAAADRVRHLARLEAQCCAFLTFDVSVAGSDVLLVITAPERAREVADDAFAPFLPDAGPTEGGERPPDREGTLVTMTTVGVAACAVCCAAPLVWPVMLAASGAGGALGWAGGGTWPLVLLMAAAAGAAVWIRRHRAVAGARPGR